jgi:hypothetical protein
MFSIVPRYDPNDLIFAPNLVPTNSISRNLQGCGCEWEVRRRGEREREREREREKERANTTLPQQTTNNNNNSRDILDVSVFVIGRIPNYGRSPIAA